MKRQLIMAATLLAVGLMAGCGGGTSTPSSTTPVSGKVADGYLVNATVFMDKNGNYQLDAGEPFATTDQNGAYTLNVDPADVGKYPIVALAIAGQTIDTDNNPAMTPLANSYVLSMPATDITGTVNSGNFISPMSSQLREMMETGNYTMQQAMEQLRTQLGLPVGINMMANYMSDPNNATYQAMHTSAQNMASLMGSQMGQVVSTSGSTTMVDVNRYRGMMGTIFSNMSAIRSTSSSPSAMSNLMGAMAATLPTIPAGQPFRNMSTAFRGGMMGSTTGGMMR